MRSTRRIVFALAALLPAGANAATLEVLSASRTVWSSAYATDDVDEQTVTDSLTTEDTAPFDELVSAELSFGTNVLAAFAEQTSSIAAAALHAAGAHDAAAENAGVAGFGVAGGISRMEIGFRLDAPEGYDLDGFLEAADLGWSSVSLTGPGGTIHSILAGAQTLPVSESGTLPAGEYVFVVSTSGSAHGWPPFPSHSSGAFEVHFVLDGATSAGPDGGRPGREGAPAAAASPNPFRFTTRIAVPVGAAGPLRLYDAAGRLVRTLRTEAEGDGRGGPGMATSIWDGRDDRGAAAPAGVYFLRGEGSAGGPRGRDGGDGGGALRIVRVR